MDDSTEITLHSIFRCDILNIERGKPEIHGLPSTMTNYMLYSISRSLFAVVGGYFLPLKISYMRLARETNKIPIWIRSEYVTYIGKPSFLSSGGLAPPKNGRVGRLYVL